MSTACAGSENGPVVVPNQTRLPTGLSPGQKRRAPVSFTTATGGVPARSAGGSAPPPGTRKPRVREESAPKLMGPTPGAVPPFTRRAGKKNMPPRKTGEGGQAVTAPHLHAG